jgi:heavy metal efflux system protein
MKKPIVTALFIIFTFWGSCQDSVLTIEQAVQSAFERNPELQQLFIEYGGTFENQRRAMRHLLLVVPLSIFIIIGLLYLNFGKMKYALLILLNLPFALSGGVFLLWIRGMYLSVSASIGFVALFGVAVLNGIVLIDHINELRKNNRQNLRQNILEGSADRLRPVLMTALVASLGFIPMAFNTGPGSEVQRPLATVVIGGLITSTLLTLMVLPIIYNWMESRSDKRKRDTE